MKKKKIVVLTGAGISAESGVKTFRDADGLWEGHDVEQVATPYGFQKNPELVLNFYNGLRKQLKSVQPNAAHLLLAELQKDYEVVVITQNVDDLHERAGSKNIIHLHGELLKMRSADDPNEIYDCTGDIKVGDLTPTGAQLRPHIVWFGEDVPLIVKAAEEVESADIVLVIGTSLQVYPAAGLMNCAEDNVPIYYIDPRPSISSKGRLTVIAEKASTGVAMSNFPKFILGDNTDMPDAMFVVHLEYPRFVLNLDTDEVEWLEEFEEEDTKELEAESENLIAEAFNFYEREVARIEEDNY